MPFQGPAHQIDLFLVLPYSTFFLNVDKLVITIPSVFRLQNFVDISHLVRSSFLFFLLVDLFSFYSHFNKISKGAEINISIQSSIFNRKSCGYVYICSYSQITLDTDVLSKKLPELGKAS